VFSANKNGLFALSYKSHRRGVDAASKIPEIEEKGLLLY
jgi:hypothetical protein